MYAASLEKLLPILACPPPNAPNWPRPQTLAEAELCHEGSGEAVTLDVMQAHLVQASFQMTTSFYEMSPFK